MLRSALRSSMGSLRAINHLSVFSVSALLFFARSEQLLAQESTLDADINKHRKGDLIIQAKAGDKVNVEQLSHEFWFGCAISNNLVGDRWSQEDRDKYKQNFLKNFNSAVTENAVKWGSMEPEKGKVNYEVVDGILAWTEANNIPLRGHNLFWGIEKFVQPWVKALTDEELTETLKHRAETVTARYKGRFAEYDLNNEMIHGNYYEERLGPDITKRMAEWTHNGDPNAELWLNDYDILTGKRLADYTAQIRKLLGEDVRIAGIGVQGHLHAESFDREALQYSLDSLAVFGLPIRITEFNIPGQRSKYYRENIRTMTPEEEQAKAKDLVDYYRICFAHPAVTGILMWGFWEGANWIPVSSLYKRDWTPTPAAQAYEDLIFREWWTKASETAGKGGVVKVPAFFGRYKVTVNGVSKEVELRKEDGEAVVNFRSR